MDQEKGNINAYKNNEEATGIKEWENFSDNIDLNPFSAKPDNTHIYMWKVDYKSAIGCIIFKAAIEDNVFWKRRIF